MHAIHLNPDRSSSLLKGRFVVHATFLLLFPGFFFYQTLLGLGVINAVLGGYFSIVAVPMMVPLVWFFFDAVKRDGQFPGKVDFYFFLFILYYSVVIAVNFAGGADRAIVQRYVLSMVFCVDIYIIFRMVDLNDKKFIAAAAFSLAVMSAITMYFSIGGFFYLRNLDEAANPDSLASYQGFARSYIYTFLIVISVARFIGGRIVLYGLAIVSLFLNGARSEFSGALFLIPIIELYRAKHKLYSVGIVSLMLIWLAGSADAIVNMLPDNRILQLFDVSHSSSGVAREQLSRQAWHTIAESPIFGDFGSYADGYYAHNILCAWVDFGLLGLLFLAALLVWPAVRLFAGGYFSKKKTGDFILSCSFVCLAILWALTAKSVPDMSVGAALGAFAKYLYGARRN